MDKILLDKMHKKGYVSENRLEVMIHYKDSDLLFGAHNMHVFIVMKIYYTNQ